jgi:hypothetical protein
MFSYTEAIQIKASYSSSHIPDYIVLHSQIMCVTGSMPNTVSRTATMRTITILNMSCYTATNPIKASYSSSHIPDYVVLNSQIMCVAGTMPITVSHTATMRIVASFALTVRIMKS